jgi:hypothetical protein
MFKPLEILMVCSQRLELARAVLNPQVDVGVAFEGVALRVKGVAASI